MNRRQSKRQRRGVVIVLAAFFMVFMVGMVAFGIDCGIITLAQTQLQAAADAAAIAGVDALVNGTTAAQTAAQTAGQANKAGGAAVSIVASSDIEFGTWNGTARTFTVLTGAARTNANAIRATCQLSQSRGTALNLFFAPVFGNTSVDVSAQAIAIPRFPCGFVGLQFVTISGGSYTDSYFSSSGYSASTARSHGNVCSNGNIGLSGGLTVVHGDAHAGIGATYSTSGGASTTGSTANLTYTLVEPPVDNTAAAASNNNANIPLSHAGKTAYNSGTRAFTLSGGDSLTLPGGTYYFSTLTLSGGCSITVSSAVKIYCTGNIDTSGGSIDNTTAIPSNLQLYTTGSKCVLSGASQTYAVVYCPGADITRSGGTSDFFGSMVGKSLTLSGGGGLHYDESLRGPSRGAQLVK
jgi:Flp pilus assembly protein TadG